MSKRGQIRLGMAAGAVWACGITLLGRKFAPAQPLDDRARPIAFLLCGLVLLAMIARLAKRRFFDDGAIDGQGFAAGSPGEVDQRVLTNTVEQVLLALCLWPFAALVLGHGVLVALAIGFVLSRLAFWIGYHISPPLRAFGFAATFYTTILITALAGVIGWQQGVFAL